MMKKARKLFILHHSALVVFMLLSAPFLYAMMLQTTKAL